MSHVCACEKKNNGLVEDLVGGGAATTPQSAPAH